MNELKYYLDLAPCKLKEWGLNYLNRIDYAVNIKQIEGEDISDTLNTGMKK